MPRFVILEHDHPFLHWDLMLEQDGTLRTWRLLEKPERTNQSGTEIEAERLADHRSAYLEYEGPVSGDRGSVTRWDSGRYSISNSSGDHLCLHMDGQRLSGDFVIERVAGSAGWSFRRIHQAS